MCLIYKWGNWFSLFSWWLFSIHFLNEDQVERQNESSHSLTSASLHLWSSAGTETLESWILTCRITYVVSALNYYSYPHHTVRAEMLSFFALEWMVRECLSPWTLSCWCLLKDGCLSANWNIISSVCIFNIPDPTFICNKSLAERRKIQVSSIEIVTVFRAETLDLTSTSTPFPGLNSLIN